jgi:hypothetical protein
MLTKKSAVVKPLTSGKFGSRITINSMVQSISMNVKREEDAM